MAFGPADGAPLGLAEGAALGEAALGEALGPVEGAEGGTAEGEALEGELDRALGEAWGPAEGDACNSNGGGTTASSTSNLREDLAGHG